MSSTALFARFNDGKADDALRTIGEVSAAFGIKQHILRYWEQQFPMLRPLKRSGGRRYYRTQDIALIEQINRLINKDGYTLKGALQVIAAGNAPDSRATEGQDHREAGAPSSIPSGKSAAEILPQLRAIRNRLEQALAN